MVRDYSNQVPEEYRAEHQGYMIDYTSKECNCNDVTVEEPTPDQPSGGTYKLTFNGNEKGYNHVVFVIPKDEACVSGATLNMKFDINSAVNFPELVMFKCYKYSIHQLLR